MFFIWPVDGTRAPWILENVGKSLSWVAVHNALLSWAGSDMMALAEPDLRKAASLTELINESWSTTGVASGSMGFSGSGVKCKASLNGNDDGAVWSGLASSVDRT